jgi:hypothetical protein
MRCFDECFGDSVGRVVVGEKAKDSIHEHFSNTGGDALRCVMVAGCRWEHIAMIRTSD